MQANTARQKTLGYGVAASVLQIFSLLLGSALLIGVTPSQAQRNFESPPTFRASKILPAELLSGPNHRVDERVVNDGFMNLYTVNSRFGTFTANSDAELRIRVGEVNSIARMEDLAESEQFARGVGKVGLDALDIVVHLITDLVDIVEDTVSEYFDICADLGAKAQARRF